MKSIEDVGGHEESWRRPTCSLPSSVLHLSPHHESGLPPPTHPLILLPLACHPPPPASAPLLFLPSAHPLISPISSSATFLHDLLKKTQNPAPNLFFLGGSYVCTCIFTITNIWRGCVPKLFVFTEPYIVPVAGPIVHTFQPAWEPTADYYR